MTGQFYFALVNPVLALVFALVFALVWHRQQHRTYLGIMAVAFLCSGLGFILHEFMMIGESVWRLLANLLFLLAILFACVAAILRAGVKVPVAGFAAISVLGMSVLAWYLFASASLPARIVVSNLTLAGLATLTLHRLVAARPRSGSDWLIVGIIAFALGFSALRLAMTVLQSDDLTSLDVFPQSVYWATAQLFTAVFSVVIAFSFLATAASEVVGELRWEAHADPLSGLANRRGFEAAAATLLKRNEAGARSTSILLADLDDFKRINDTFGHEVGDNVIARVGEILARFGEADVAGRIGGEEFALLYSNMRRTDLHTLAVRMQMALRREMVEGLPADHPVTMSVGIYTGRHAETLSDILGGADRALYAAKREGKNRVELAPLSLRDVKGDKPSRPSRIA